MIGFFCRAKVYNLIRNRKKIKYKKEKNMSNDLYYELFPVSLQGETLLINKDIGYEKDLFGNPVFDYCRMAGCMGAVGSY